MCEEKIVSIPIRVSEWPELDRNGVIVSRMTAEPQPTRIHLVTSKVQENSD
ncbi:MAG: hypothetical protein ACFFED_13295 [Candidatus Thorarchaeota archaeon]